MTKEIQTLPMRTSGTQHLIERTYRESGRYQWARETLVNALEASATKVLFGVEWQAVEAQGVYRRVIADDGAGMNADQLVDFFNTFGAGGKPIGGVHENFGVGAKTSLLPWNREGLVVISYVEGQGSMIWVRQDPTTGEYGLKLFHAMNAAGEETLEAVVEPFDNPAFGCDWRKVRPSWLKDHGTVVVLLGNSTLDDTVLGDPNRDEQDLKGLASYLNRRFWEIPEGVEVSIEELRVNEKTSWPKTRTAAKDDPDRRTNKRVILGAKHWIDYRSGNFHKGALRAHGHLKTPDQTLLRWWLWEGDRPAIQSYAALQGYVAALYQNELYDVTSHLATYRSFGVTDASVRQRLWIVAEPPPFDPKVKAGVYPRTDRNALLIQGGPNSGGPLPVADWAAYFADHMPDEVREALRSARHEEGTVDEAWRDKLLERFGSRWRVAKLRAIGDATGTLLAGVDTVAPTQPGSPSPPPRDVTTAQEGPEGPEGPVIDREPSAKAAGEAGAPALGSDPGPRPARKTKVGGGLPTYRYAKAEEMEPGMLAAWQAHDPEHPEGVVLLNGDHPVIKNQIRYWTDQYADHLAPDVEREVLSVYGQIAVAKVAHSERLKGVIPSAIIDRDLRSDAALTMSLLGLVAEEQVVAARLGAKYGRRKAPTDATRE